MAYRDSQIRKARDRARFHKRVAERREHGLCIRCGKQASASVSRPGTIWRERAFVLGGLGLALIATIISCATGAAMQFIGFWWMTAIAWTVIANIACALWRGFRHGDWSAFRAYELPEDTWEVDEWSAKTGQYSYLQDWEDRHRHDDGHLRDHGMS